jgi:MoaA/NifB/PqqE/SkfB family radical SAM enzyme
MFAAATYENVTRWEDYGELARRTGNGNSQCMAGRYYIHIEPNGDVHPCIQHAAAFTPKNLVRDGFEAALANAQQHDCGNCFSAYLNERKALFGMQPRALLELARRG